MNARAYVTGAQHEVQRGPRLQHHRFQYAATQLRGERMIEQDAAHVAVQCLAGRQLHGQLVQGEFHRPPAFDVAVTEAAAFHVELDVEAAHQFATLIALRGKFEVEAAEMSFDAAHARQQLGQSAKVGIARAERQFEFRRIRVGIGLDISRQCNAYDRCFQWSVQHPVLQLQLQSHVLDVARKAQPAPDAQSQIEIRTVHLLEAERRGRQAAIDVGEAARRVHAFRLGFLPEKRAQIESRQDQRAGDFRLGPGIVEIEGTDQRRVAHGAGQPGKDHPVRGEDDGPGDTAGPDVRQPGLQQALELEQVFGTEAERHLAPDAVDAAADRQRRTQEGQREGDGPGLVGGKVRQLAAGEIQPVGKFLLDRAVQGQCEGLAGRRLRRQRMQAEKMLRAVWAGIADLQFFQRDLLNVEQRESLVRAHRRRGTGFRRLRRRLWRTPESPVIAAVRANLQTGTHVAARKFLDMKPLLE